LPVGVVYDNGDAFDSSLYRATIDAALESGVPIRPLAAGDALHLDPQVSIRVLHPGPEADAHPNDASVVLLMTFGRTAFLFTGDVEVRAEASIARRFQGALCADIIKVPHHGSRTSSTQPFVDAITSCGNGQYAVVQVARRNRYGLPNDEALDAWRAQGLRVIPTYEAGAVWLRSDGVVVWKRAWRR
jgi:competence protein ComEC